MFCLPVIDQAPNPLNSCFLTFSCFVRLINLIQTAATLFYAELLMFLMYYLEVSSDLITGE